MGGIRVRGIMHRGFFMISNAHGGVWRIPTKQVTLGLRGTHDGVDASSVKAWAWQVRVHGTTQLEVWEWPSAWENRRTPIGN